MTKEVKASRIGMTLLHKEIGSIVDLMREEAGLPAGANLDIGRGVWVVPDEKSDA